MLWSCLMSRAHMQLQTPNNPQMLVTVAGTRRLWMSWNSSALNLFWPSTNWGIYPHTPYSHTLTNTHTHACFFHASVKLEQVSRFIKHSTYISVMFSMSDSGTKTGKSSIPGSWSIHEILEALQKHDTGQAELSLSSPSKTPHNPKRAIPRTPAVMAGLARCIRRCVMSYSIFSNSEMRDAQRRCARRETVMEWPYLVSAERW